MMATSNFCNSRELKIVSYNLHGFNQGYFTVDELISSIDPDVFLCQEHWLTPANLHKFADHYGSYFAFGSTAMSTLVEAGILRGRPFGGLMCLIKNDLRNQIQPIHSDERFVVLRVANILLFNVYLPCVGTPNRLLTCQHIFEELWCLRERYIDCECIIAGDFNADLNSCVDDVAKYVNSFISTNGLSRCDDLSPYRGQPTYINLALIVLHRDSKKGATITMAITCQFLIDLQNSFTAAKSTKFPTKHVLGYLLTVEQRICNV